MAFRGTYLKRLWLFIEERDSAGRRQGPRGLNQRVSARMMKSTDKELALPRFTMSVGTRGKHSLWPVAKEVPASPSPNRSELTVEDPRRSSTHKCYIQCILI